MANTKRNKLIGLGPEKLADALLAMTNTVNEVDVMVERLDSSPGETVKRAKAKLAGLKRARRFIDWRKVGGFARDLEGLLADIEENVEDGKVGVELVASFLECDRAVFERCDDSNGWVGGVFKYNASKLFARFATECPDKKWLAKLIVKLLGSNDYGAKDTLLDSAAEFLPVENLRDLADKFWQLAEEASGKYQRQGWYRGVEELAEQMGMRLFLKRPGWHPGENPVLPPVLILPLFTCNSAIRIPPWLGSKGIKGQVLFRQTNGISSPRIFIPSWVMLKK